jgi:LysR family transcriptional regulator, transcriptional activator of nhaA
MLRLGGALLQGRVSATGIIFALGQELITALGQEPSERPLRLQVGISDSVPKVIARKVLLPVFRLPRPVRLVCRAGDLRDLVTQLAARQLDVVLAHEPSTSAFRLKTLNFRLEKSGVVLCASARLVAKLRRTFPHSLNGAPAVGMCAFTMKSAIFNVARRGVAPDARCSA